MSTRMNSAAKNVLDTAKRQRRDVLSSRTCPKCGYCEQLHVATNFVSDERVQKIVYDYFAIDSSGRFKFSIRDAASRNSRTAPAVHELIDRYVKKHVIVATRNSARNGARYEKIIDETFTQGMSRRHKHRCMLRAAVSIIGQHIPYSQLRYVPNFIENEEDAEETI